MWPFCSLPLQHIEAVTIGHKASYCLFLCCRQEFNVALKRTKGLLLRLLCDESTLKDIFVIREERFRSVNVEEEFAALVEYSEFRSITSDVQKSPRTHSSPGTLISLTVRTTVSGAAEKVRHNIRATLELLQYSSIVQVGTLVGFVTFYMFSAPPSLRSLLNFSHGLWLLRGPSLLLLINCSTCAQKCGVYLGKASDTVLRAWTI